MRCEFCKYYKYWNPFSGECRYNAPVCVPNKYDSLRGDAVFPRVEGNQFCGKFEKRD